LRAGDLQTVESASASVYSFIRSTGDETVLVIVNLSDKPQDNYALTLAEGTLSAGAAPVLLYGEGEPSALTLNAAGGFDNYAPFPVLAPYSATVIQLNSAG